MKAAADLTGEAGAAEGEGEEAEDWWAGLAGVASCRGTGESLWGAGEATLGALEARASGDSVETWGIRGGVAPLGRDAAATTAAGGGGRGGVANVSSRLEQATSGC